jgi:hypothetical protein
MATSWERAARSPPARAMVLKPPPSRVGFSPKVWFETRTDAGTRARLVREPLPCLHAVAAVDRRVALPAEMPEGRTTASVAVVARACWKARGVMEQLLREHPELSAHSTVGSGANGRRRAWCALTQSLEVIDAGRRHAHDRPEARG